MGNLICECTPWPNVPALFNDSPPCGEDRDLAETLRKSHTSAPSFMYCWKLTHFQQFTIQCSGACIQCHDRPNAYTGHCLFIILPKVHLQIVDCLFIVHKNEMYIIQAELFHCILIQMEECSVKQLKWGIQGKSKSPASDMPITQVFDLYLMLVFIESFAPICLQLVCDMIIYSL